MCALLKKANLLFTTENDVERSMAISLFLASVSGLSFRDENAVHDDGGGDVDKARGPFTTKQYVEPLYFRHFY